MKNSTSKKPSRGTPNKPAKDNLSKYLLVAGVFLVVFGAYLGRNQLREYLYNLHRPHATTFAQAVSGGKQPEPSAKLIEGNPVHLFIPSLGIDLDVTNGYYYQQSHSWTLSNDKAQYAAITPLPNNREGNTFIYGHALTNIFGNLYKISPGAELILKTSNKHTFIYKFMSSLETNPNDDTLFQYKGSPILTVQTCSGLWYQNRQLFAFKLVRAV